MRTAFNVQDTARGGLSNVQLLGAGHHGRLVVMLLGFVNPITPKPQASAFPAQRQMV